MKDSVNEIGKNSVRYAGLWFFTETIRQPWS